MRPQISKATEWKLDAFAKQMLHGVKSDSLPASQKVRLLVEEHEGFMDSMDTTWTQRAGELRNEVGEYYLPGHYDSRNISKPTRLDASLDDYRRMHIDDEIVEDLKEVLAEEKPAQSKIDQSFDNVLGLVLESYNSWAKQVDVGWD